MVLNDGSNVCSRVMGLNCPAKRVLHAHVAVSFVCSTYWRRQDAIRVLDHTWGLKVVSGQGAFIEFVFVQCCLRNRSRI